MSIGKLWRHWFDVDPHAHSARHHRSLQQSQPGLRCRLGVEWLEDRRLLSLGPVGPEFQVNTFTTLNQIFPSVAVGTDGDFVIAWSSDGQAGVFAQQYNAAGVPQGSEFQVNTSPSGSGPSVAMENDGDFVVAWRRSAGVFARTFNATGEPQGSEFKVNTSNNGGYGSPSVALDADGDFVIAWTSGDNTDRKLYAQRFDAAGVPQGGEFRVDTFTRGVDQICSVAMDADGEFVLTWSTGTVYARRYNAAGEPQGSEFQVNTFTTFNEFRPSVAMDPDGDFVITWRGLDGLNNYGVYGQRYNAAGAPQGGAFRANTFTTGNQDEPSVAMDAHGDFVITWYSLQDGSGYGIYAQRYNAAGVPLGSEVRVNTFTNNHQRYPSVAMSPESDFVIAWASYGQDGSGTGIYAQRFANIVLVSDNSDPTGFSLSGEWAPGGGPGVGRNNNVYVAFGESFLPTDVATWTFTVDDPGRYRVAATWFTNTGFPHLFTSAARYDVSDAAMGAVRGTTLVNQKQFPDDFTDAGSSWEDLGVFDITGTTLQVRLFSSGDDQTYVVADAIRIERIEDLSQAAEIQVTENGFDVPDNGGVVSFGTTDLHHSSGKTFTISNAGTQPLHLTSPVTVPSGYTLLIPPVLTTLLPGQTTSFVVRLDAALPGTFAGQISFGNDDSDEGPFNFNVTGTVQLPRIIDNGALGYFQTGDFQSTASSVARDGDISYVHSQAAPSAAFWTFTVTPGVYLIAATWFDTAGITAFASNAPFTVFDGATTVGTFLLNQQEGPNDFTADGSSWELIDSIFDITSTALTVRLTNMGANGYVLADAIRLVRLGSPNNAAEGGGLKAGDATFASIVSFSGGLLRGDVAQTAATDEAIATVYWDDESEAVSGLLAEIAAGKEWEELAHDLATSDRIEDEAMTLGLSNWPDL